MEDGIPSGEQDAQTSDNAASPPELIPSKSDGRPSPPHKSGQPSPMDLGPSRKDGDLFVVGVGASAGGLEALESFFEHMPAESGMAFVVIQHLSPDYKSLMDELLARRTQMPIHHAENGMLVERENVYLIPPRTELRIHEGRLDLREVATTDGLHLPINAFLESLAADFGEQSISVILSGSGSDGARGVRAIHEAGGLVVVQSQDSAAFDSMPRSALETQLADLVLPPGEMAQALLSYASDPRSQRRGYVARDDIDPNDGVLAIFRLLQREYGLDFTHYKAATVVRRIERRLEMVGLEDLAAYVELLKQDFEELTSLYRDLLIGVTRFFRDASAFDALKKMVIPELLREDRGDAEIRVWVAGCATGEEAYSIAMLFHEVAAPLKRPLRLKVFATDVHSESIEFAARGVYGPASVEGMSAERLDRFFLRDNDNYKVRKSLRKDLVFTTHNVLSDAPFTRMDLVTCRNLLIYFQPLAQKKALTLFHFALRPRGVLTLGPSENPGQLSQEFGVVDKVWKVYRKLRDTRLPRDFRMPVLPSNTVGQRQPVTHAPTQRPAAPAVPDSRLLRMYDLILADYVPAALLIDEQRELIHAFGEVNSLLRVPTGRATLDVLEVLPEALRMPLLGAVQRCTATNKPSRFSQAECRDANGQLLRFDLEVKPLVDPGSHTTWFLATFRGGAVAQEEEEREAETEAVTVPGHVADLQHELRYAKENLQATIEELETSNEEIQATNEELVASNEELQSTNEELHSVNEELHTVNAEYERKIEELTQITNDMDNLLRSTEIGTVFLDREMRIRKFTPAISRNFDLLPSDEGRRISAFANGVDYENLLHDLDSVMRTAVPQERTVKNSVGDWFLMRIMPYRSDVGDVEGVVMSFIDITPLKRAEDQLREANQRLEDHVAARTADLADRERLYRMLSESAFDCIWTLDKFGGFDQECLGWERFTGTSWDAACSGGFGQMVREDDRERFQKAWGEAVQTQRDLKVSFHLWHAESGSHRPVDAVLTLVRDQDGSPLEWVGGFSQPRSAS